MAENITIKCEECAHQNEPERVYCHNCGAKLDRSLLPRPEDKKNYETNEEKKRRVSGIVNPRNTWVKRDFKALVKTLVFSALIAAVVLYWWPPENAPAALDEAGDFMLRDQWQRQMESSQASLWEYKELEANRFMNTIKGTEGVIPGITFKSLSVKFSPGIVTIFMERDAWGIGFLWSSVSYKPTFKNGKFVPEVIGVYHGRLGLHPSMTFAHTWGIDAALKMLEKDFAKVRLADKELHSFDRIASVQVEEGRLIITTKPATATP